MIPSSLRSRIRAEPADEEMNRDEAAASVPWFEDDSTSSDDEFLFRLDDEDEDACGDRGSDLLEEDIEYSPRTNSLLRRNRELALAFAAARKSVPVFCMLDEKNLNYPALRIDAKSKYDDKSVEQVANVEPQPVALPISCVPDRDDDEAATDVSISNPNFLRSLDEIAAKKLAMDFGGGESGAVFFRKCQWFTTQSGPRTIDFGPTTASSNTTDTGEKLRARSSNAYITGTQLVATIVLVFPSVAERISIQVSTKHFPEAAAQTVTLTQDTLRKNGSAMWIYGSGALVLNSDGPALVGLFDVYDGPHQCMLGKRLFDVYDGSHRKACVSVW
mmetsp:Transcript_20361/g.51421  ORF Transcript_20361/g.51421 Transcript_20361/m.51421 type:complete len:331 (+) Transcript_20361:67-1059(+)